MRTVISLNHDLNDHVDFMNEIIIFISKHLYIMKGSC
jgi:hypothetical protein